MSESPTLAGLPIHRPKKARFRLLKRILLMLFVVIVLLVIAAWLLQNLIGNAIFDGLVGEMSAELGTEVRCEKVEFTWKDGFELEGFRISNPEGFGPTAAFEVQSARMDMRISSLLSGKYEISGKLVAPEIEIRKNSSGKSNWEQLVENQRSHRPAGAGGDGKSSKRREVRFSTQGDGTSLAELQAQLRDLEADFSIERGKVKFIDEKQGERHAIEELQLRLAASEEKHGALFHMGGILTGANHNKTSEISLVATFPTTGRPTLGFKAPDGIRLQDYRGLLSPFLEKDFSSFAGLVRGELRAAYQEKPALVELEGHLAIEGLDIIGGPLGEGIGVRAASWTLDPAISLDLSGGEKVPDLQGTRIDLGFLTLSVITPEAARDLLAKESRTEARSALGFTASLDLAGMAKEIQHPALQGYSGKVNITLAMDPAISEQRALPLACVYEVKDLVQDAQITGKDFKLPPEITGRLVMDLVGGEKIVPGPIREEANAPGFTLKATMEDAMKPSSEAKVAITVDPAQAKAWLPANLPAGVELKGPLTAILDLVGGRWNEDFPRLVEGNITSEGIAYQGNQLENGSYKIHYAKGRLDLASDGDTTLNKGPMQVTAKVQGLDKPGADLDFSLQTTWKDGVAAWGLTPYIQYAFPFLAGLDLKKGTKLAQLDYRSFASLELQVDGKIPANKDKLSQAMGLWTGKGQLTLKDGSFTPSQAFAGLIKLFGSKDKLDFREFSNGFEIDKGKLSFKDARIGGGDGHLVLRGATGLDGTLDIQVDFTDLLSRHRDGKRVLAAAGGKPIQVHMGGTLNSPDFPIENLIQGLFQNAVKGGIDDILKGIQKGKKPEESLKDWFKKMRGK